MSDLYHRTVFVTSVKQPFVVRNLEQFLTNFGTIDQLEFEDEDSLLIVYLSPDEATIALQHDGTFFNRQSLSITRPTRDQLLILGRDLSDVLYDDSTEIQFEEEQPWESVLEEKLLSFT